MNGEGFGKMSENFRHFSNKVANFSEINWSDGLNSVGISAEGKDGVIFIETQRGSVVFKAADDVSVDVFMTKLAIKLLVRVPQIRVISYDSVEFKQMMRAIEKYCYTNELLYQVIMRRLNRPFYQLMEYIPSIKLNSVGKERFQAIFESEVRLGQLGRILGYDMILNNSDRIQLYWTNEGNADNLLFQVKHRHGLQLTNKIVDDYADVESVEFGDVFMIDTRPTIIDPTNKMATKNYEEMTQKLTSFIKRLLQFIKQTSRKRSEDLGNDLFQKLNDQLYKHTGCKFNNSHQIQIGKSVLRVLYSFYLQFPVNKLSQLVFSLKRTNKLWEDTYWNQSLDSLHMNYFAGLRATFETHLLPDQALLRQLAAEVNQSRRGSLEQSNTGTHQQVHYTGRLFAEEAQNQKSSIQLAAVLGQEEPLEKFQQQQGQSDSPSRKEQSVKSIDNRTDPMQVQGSESSLSRTPTPVSNHELELSPNTNPKRSGRQILQQKLSKFRDKNTLQ